MQNNRDHKKIVVIDGKKAYTGGINISDEYINLFERCGKWKDSGILLTGKAVAGLTKIFLEMWYLNSPADQDPSVFLQPAADCGEIRNRNYVIPYADTPVSVEDSTENLGQKVYTEVINHAQKYLYIMTPYFIPGEPILESIRLAAESGVDVRMITPRIGDKAFIHAVTRSYYSDLISAGVRVYEYTPGFVHSKVFVCDDQLATVGTMNLDYRSLYLHFECGALLCSAESAKNIQEDFLKTLTECVEITKESAEKRPLFLRLFTSLLRIFEPLL